MQFTGSGFISEEDDQSVFETIGEFTTHGLSSAAVSAGIGFVNTGISLVNTLGGDFEEVDTEETLRNWGAEETANYYSDHKTAMDTIGFIGGSLIPGGIAVKGLRTMQKGMSTSARLSTGFRKALLPKNYIKATRNSIKAQGANVAAAELQANKLKMIASGFHQQAMEAAAFEGAVLLSMNQSPVLDNEDLTYFEGITENLGHAGFGLLFGGAIGGTFQAVADIGAAKALVREADLSTKSTTKVLSEGTKNHIVTGDKAAAPLKSYFEAKTKIADDSFSGLDSGVRRNLIEQQRQSREALQAELATLTKNNPEIGEPLFNILDSSENYDEAVRLLAGVKEYRPIYQRDIIFDPPTSQIDFAFQDDAAKYLETTLGYTPEQAKRHVKGTEGFMVTQLDDVTGQPLTTRGISTIEEVKDWDNIFTWRHETGHVFLNETAENIRKKSKLGRRLADQAEALSRQARPAGWEIVDNYRRAVESGSISGLSPNLMKTLEDQAKYYESPRELLADAYSLLSNPETAAQAKEAAPDLYKFMVGNKALAKEFTAGRQALDLRSAELVDAAITPTAPDVGKEFIVKGKAVQYGNNKAIALDTKFDVDNIDYLDASALNSAALARKDIKAGMEIDYLDIPKLTAAKAQGIDVKIMQDGVQLDTTIDNALLKAKVDVGSYLLYKSSKAQTAIKRTGGGIADARDPGNVVMTDGQIARIIDTGEGFVERLTAYREIGIDVNTLDDATNILNTNRDIPFYSVREGVDPTKPNFAMVYADPRAVSEGKRLQGTAEMQMRIRAERESYEAIYADYFGDNFQAFPQSTYSSEYNFADNVSVVDKTSGVVTSANQELLSGGQTAQYIGKLKDHVDRTNVTKISDQFDSLIVKAAQEEDTIYEAAVLDTKLRQTLSGKEYEFMPGNIQEYIDTQGIANRIQEDSFKQLSATGILNDLFKEGDNIANGEIFKRLNTALTKDIDAAQAAEIADNIRELLPNNYHTIKSKTLAKFWRQMVKYNGEEIVRHRNRLSTAIGDRATLNPRALYPGVIDTQRYSHHALVVSKDKAIMAQKDTGIVVAKDSNELQRKIAQVKSIYGDKVEIHTTKQIEAYKQAKGEFEASSLFRESLMDSNLKRKGVSWDVLPEPNPEIFNSYKASLERQQKALSGLMLRSKYSEEIGVLENYANQLDIYHSVYGNVGRDARNVYKDTINMMLNQRADTPNTLWNKINTVTDAKISEAFYALRGTMMETIKTGDFEKMNKVLEDYGLDKIYSEQNQLMLSKVSAPKPELSRLTSKLNWIVGTSMLRMDAAHSIVNVASLPIMLTSEINALKRVVSKGRLEVLKNGNTIKIPGTETTIPNSGKMMLQAVKNFFKKPELVKKYRAEGLINSTLDDITSAHADFARLAGETDIKLANKTVDNIVNTLSKPTDFSEQFVKFIAANVADMASETLKLPARARNPLINNFVTRVHGNYLASQRPLLFQGWMGQAVGLFQTYQFNLMQSLFGNVAKGNKAAVAKMLVAQGSIFGAQSVPGFQLVNEYVGKHSDENNDFYKLTGETVGDDLSNWLMYGTASSAMVPIVGDGIDLYSRGDLTPRTPILIPTSPAEIPAIAITSSFFGSLANAVSRISDGAPWGQTALDALGHNGFNRPLQGIANLISGERTTNRGSLLRSYDIDLVTLEAMDLWNIATKALGTKTLSESVAVSSFYRTAAYSSHRSSQLTALGEAYKQSVYAGENPTDLYYDFASRYVEKGGDIENFSRWITRQHKNATVSQINQLRRNNNSPEGRYLQEVMGASIEDYTVEGYPDF